MATLTRQEEHYVKSLAPVYAPTELARLLSHGRWQSAPHLELLAYECVMAVMGWGPKRLIVEMPPRHGKSEFISHYFPVWFLNLFPWLKVMLCSYESNFAGSWGRKVRDTIVENQQHLAVAIKEGDAAAKGWSTPEGGGMMTAGVGGPITGRGAHLLIVDDPVKNAEEAYSEVYRQKAYDWWQSTAYTRLEPGGVAIVVMTRWHEDDLAGRLIRQMQEESGEVWKVVRLPAVAEQDESIPPLWARKEGAPLWPVRYGIEDFKRIEDAVGPGVWQALYQQNPTNPGGTWYQRDWYANGRSRYLTTDPILAKSVIARWISWDTALKDTKTAAYSVATVGELTRDYQLALREVHRDRLSFPLLIAKMEELAGHYNRDGKLHGVIIEDKVSGSSAYQTLVNAAPEWLKKLVVAYQPQGGKEVRAQQAAAWCANGSVLLPFPGAQVDWLYKFEQELFNAPATEYLDQVDSFAQLILFTEHLLAQGWEQRRAAQAELEQLTLEAA